MENYISTPSWSEKLEKDCHRVLFEPVHLTRECGSRVVVNAMRALLFAMALTLCQPSTNYTHLDAGVECTATLTS